MKIILVAAAIVEDLLLLPVRVVVAALAMQATGISPRLKLFFPRSCEVMRL